MADISQDQAASRQLSVGSYPIQQGTDDYKKQDKHSRALSCDIFKSILAYGKSTLLN
jgi:hypothetical protein